MGKGTGKRSPTLQDVADLTELSVSTVSRALSGKHREVGITEATRRRVLDAARRLRYAPDRQAQGLRTGRTHVLGACLISVPDGENFVFRLFSGVFNEALSHDVSVLVCNSLSEADDRAALDRFERSHVDGVIFWQRIHTLDTTRRLHALLDAGVPVATVMEKAQGCECPFVGRNEREGGRMAAEHLIDLGRRRIAYIGPMSADPTPDWRTLSRHAGYREVLRERGLPYVPERVVRTESSTYEDGADAMRRVLSLAELPDALFAYNDKMALAARRVCREAGLRVPDDIAVAGYDGSDYAAYADVPLTTVRMRLFDIGAKAVDLVLGEGEVGRGEEVLLTPELVVRESTAGAGEVV